MFNIWADMTNSHSDQGPSAELDLASRLMDEYKIIQDKIDKIGAFRFTIKGWSITVIIASIFAGNATSVGPRWLWGISLVGFLGGFFLYERQQTNIGYRLGNRSIVIESVLSRLLRKAARDSDNVSVSSSFIILRYVPGIAHIRGRRGRRSGRRTLWRSCYEADVLFYIAQVLLVMTFVFFGGSRSPERRGGDVNLNISSAPVDAPASADGNQLQPARLPDGEKNSARPGSGDNGNNDTKKEKHKSD
jgi:hypothetical protein